MKKFTLITALFLCTVWIAYGQWTYTNLSEPKEWMGSASVGNKVYFAGGYNGTEFLDEVQVYDISTGTWDVAGGLFNAREFPGGSVTCGSKIFFGGGFNWVTSFNTVDIYDTQIDEWSVEFLSDDRFSIASVSCGTKVMFAGGVDYPALVYKTIVDIYDIQTGEWTTTNLSIAREGIAAAVVGDLAIFAGGLTDNGVTDRVDIYNFSSATWSIATLSQARGMAIATTVGNKVIIAGGAMDSNISTDRVDIYDASDGSWTTASLSLARAAHHNAVTVGGKAYFVGGGKFTGSGFSNPSDVIDVYDAASNTWSVMNLQTARVQHSVNAVGDYLVVAGGKNNSGQLSSVEIYRHPTLLHVPGDYATIQEAINEASHYDTVLVAGGTYYENINFIGKPILVASEFIIEGDTNHTNNTIIDGSQPVNPDIGSVVTFGSGEDTTSVLCGFTITGGTGTFVDVAGNARFGGGVVIFVSGAKLLNNHIENNIVTNEEWASGGGICAIGPPDNIPMPWVVLRGNRIIHNKVISNLNEGDGGGADIFYNLIMENNEVSWNEAEGPYRGDGGGVRCRSDWGHTEVLIRNNNITHNKATSVSESTDIVLTGGLSIFWDCSGIISGNNVSYNEIEAGEDKGGYGTGILIDNNASKDVVLENNLIEGNTFTGGFLNGGGLCIYWSSVLVQNNILKDNTGTNGGGIYVETPDDLAVLINNTIVGNHGDNGGGLHATNANAVVINTIIWDNTAPSGASIYQQASTLEVRYSDVQGDVVWPGEGNLNCTPTFLADGYHLDNYCQLVNEGIASIMINGLWYDCPAYDIDGDVRPYASTQPEIGADEVDFATSIGSQSTEIRTTHVYPNPADQKLTISINNGELIKEVTIYNQLGQNVYRGLPEDNTLDVSKLQPGVYLIEVITNQYEIREKLIIE